MSDSASDRRDVLERAFESSPVRQGVVEVLPDDLRVLAVNEAAARLVGVPVAKLEDRRVGRFDLPPGLVDAWLESCLDAWRQHASTTFHFDDDTTDPPRRLFFSVAPLADEPDEGRWCCSFSVDDVELASAEPAGGEGSHFRHLADAAPAMLWSSNPRGERNYFNRTWLEFTGRDMARAVGEGWLDSAHEDEREACRETWQESFQSREPYRLEYRLRRADGVHRWVLDSGVPRFRSDGRFLGFVGSCVDISPRRHAEERLRISERWYRDLIESTDNLVIQIDDEFRLAFVNRRSREIWHAEPEECVGFPLFDFVHVDDRRETQVRLESLGRGVQGRQDSQVGEGEDALIFENRQVSRRGEVRSILWTMNPHLDADGRLLTASAIGQDVTERRRAEEERRRLDEHLQEAQRLESLGVLAGGIAHDFNNLLMTILGNASLLLGELSRDDAMRPDLKQIEAAALRAAELTQQMLAYSGKGRFVVEPMDLNELIDQMRPLLHSSLAQGAHLELDLADPLPPVESDGAQIKQVIVNLVTNASEAVDARQTAEFESRSESNAGDGGSIRLSTSHRTLAREDLEGLLLAHELPQGEYVVLEVSDDGVGMDEEVRARIFDPFFTTKFTGRGLGLAAVLGIVRGHRGALRVASRPEQGAIFTVYLPAAARRPKPVAVKPDRASVDTDGTILVVDDEDEVRVMAVRMLERLGFGVLEARDGREAVEIYRQHRRGVNCVLLDLTMPGMDGEQTFRELRRFDDGVKVILSSGYGEPEDDRFDGRGPSAFLQKPYRQTDLILTLDRVLDLRH